MIKINKLKLTNFMNISNQSFDFDHKLNIISGSPASGKSAIFEAICLCISSKKRSRAYPEYVKQGTDKSTIYLEAEIGLEKVVFEGTINGDRKGGAFVQTITFKDKIYRNAEATELLNSFDIEYYADIVLNMQSDQDIVNISPNNRSIYLQRLLNFDFDQQKTLVKDQQNNTLMDISRIDSDIAVQVALKDKSNSMIRSEEPLTFSNQDVIENEKQIDSLKESLVEATKTQEKTTKLHESNRVLLNDKSTLLHENNRLEYEIKALDTLKEDIEKITNEIDIKKTSIENEKKSAELKKGYWTSDVSSLEKLRLQRDSTKEELKVTEKDLTNAKSLLGLISNNKCPTCGQTVCADNSEVLSAFDLNGETINRSFVAEKLSKVDALKKELSLLTDEFNSKEKTIRDTEYELKTAETNVENMELSLISSNELLANKKAVLAEKNLDVMRTSIQKNSEKISDIDISIDDNTKLIEQLSNESDVAKMNSDLEKCLNKLHAMNKEKEDRAKIIEDNKRLKKEIDNLDSIISLKESEKAALTSHMTVLSEVYKIIDKDLPNFMIVKTCNSLQSAMNEFIHNIFPNYHVKLVSSKKGTEFFYTKDVTLHDLSINKWLNAQMSSGFERSMLTMAFKQSLCKLYGLDFCLLDECDKSADDESSVKLHDMILNESSFKQIFLISHKKALVQHLSEKEDDCVIYQARNGVFSQVYSPYD